MSYKVLFLILILSFLCPHFSVQAASPGASETEASARERQLLFEHMQAITGIPWYFMAAIDQYERNIHKNSKKKADTSFSHTSSRKTGIVFAPEIWSGLLNPNSEDTNPSSIAFLAE